MVEFPQDIEDERLESVLFGEGFTTDERFHALTDWWILIPARFKGDGATCLLLDCTMCLLFSDAEKSLLLRQLSGYLVGMALLDNNSARKAWTVRTIEQVKSGFMVEAPTSMSF